MSVAGSVGRGRAGDRRAARPTLEVLEGRALLAVAAFDPTFGAGGVAIGPADSGSGAVLSSPSALALQGDGKVVQVGVYGRGNGYGMLAVRRYNADGSADTSFGAAGQATVPLPAGALGVATAPSAVAVRPDGSVVLAATFAVASDLATPTLVGVVAQLTPAGQPDPSFGAGGEFVLPAGSGQLNAVALMPDGRVLAAGPRSASVLANYAEVVAVRLTAAGAPDPSFNASGVLTIAVPGTNVGGSSFSTYALVAGVQPAPDGGAILAVNKGTTSRLGPGPTGILLRLSAGGGLDVTYGGSGSATLAYGAINALAVQADGGVTVAGALRAWVVPILLRYLPSGAPDTSFRGLAVGNPGPKVGAFDSLTSLALDAGGGVTVGGTSRSGELVARRFTAAGLPDLGFGLRGRIAARALPPSTVQVSYNREVVTGVAVDAAGRVLVGGTDTRFSDGSIPTRSLLARFVVGPLRDVATNDFDADGRSDVAAQLAHLGIFAVRNSTGGDTLNPFGAVGPGATIPAVGDYDGDGVPDVGGYLPQSGLYAYRPRSETGDVLLAFGSAGAGASIPVPGDYDGDGTTDVVVYLTASGTFANRTTGALTPFGPAGLGNSIPAVGDYDGDGIADYAVYLPAFGQLAVAPSGGAAPYLVTFGPAGVGASIPVPGDYDGDGLTDVAVYLPASGALAVHPSSGGLNQLIPFGPAGGGAAIPAPGDYDGDGKTDVAVYLPAYGALAVRPSGGGLNYLVGFGPAGAGATVPASSSPFASGATVSAGALRGPDAGAGYLVALTDDLLPPGRPARKPRA